MHFFISYAKTDTRELATALHDKLAGLPGVTVWMDQSLKPGSSWADQIKQHIDDCDYMVALLSPDVNRASDGPNGRSFVMNEIDYALYEQRKPIIPVMAQQTSLPLQLAGIQYIRYAGDVDVLVGDILLHAGMDAQSLGHYVQGTPSSHPSYPTQVPPETPIFAAAPAATTPLTSQPSEFIRQQQSQTMTPAAASGPSSNMMMIGAAVVGVILVALIAAYFLLGNGDGGEVGGVTADEAIQGLEYVNAGNFTQADNYFCEGWQQDNSLQLLHDANVNETSCEPDGDQMVCDVTFNDGGTVTFTFDVQDEKLCDQRWSGWNS